MVLSIQPLLRSTSLSRYQRPQFVDTARQAIESEMAAKARSAREASRGLQDAQSLVRIGEGGLEAQSQIASRIRELAIQGANGGLSQEARDAIAGELGALQSEFERIGSTTTFGTNNLNDGGTLGVVADESGTRLDAVLPAMGPTTSSLAGIDSVAASAAISSASAALSATLSARAQFGAFDNQYSTAQSNLAQSMENHTQALARINAARADRESESPLARLRAELRARLNAQLANQ